ncbi:hypothetical protein Q5424_15970 [Conexibacter sp. JD483]|uniref:hypothetical protein n=1 Tax=unclassified Conexibacter TaxID=2627773 RepID=UPI002728904D|nr:MULTISPECIES: hypothetical protein [unclassified Conexibacter]MDO8186664.1 hypothetical protein [Conexibacter sp. CPCC 205706]MDO8200384.1 hypothetical protein [Conexibacter sp. CPCC 205762]MDR9370594.1 hypothetical protein [Conexibacter sp. JD483]
MGRLREERGQATNEYVALLAVMAIALAALAGISASGVGASVLRGLQRGICAVAPGPCPRLIAVSDDLAPCQLTRDDRVERLGETIGVVELGSSQTLKAVRNSDGTVVVTLADGSDAGAVWKAGAGAAAGGAEAGAKARAGVGVVWGSGRSWVLPDEAAALDFIARYGDKATTKGKLVDQVRSRCSLLCDAVGWRPHAQLPPPDATYEEAGAAARLDQLLGSGTASGQLSGVLGRRRARDGATTTYVRVDGSLLAQLNLPVGAVDGGIGGGGVLAIARAADGTPRSLTVSVAANAAGHAALAGRARARRAGSQGGSGVGGGSAQADLLRGALVELEASLDLSDPANLAAASALVAALADPAALPDLPQRAATLGARFERAGQIDLRAYRKRASARQYGAEIGLGVGLGWKQTTSGLDLLAAWTRLPGLPFLVRDDCRST